MILLFHLLFTTILFLAFSYIWIVTVLCLSANICYCIATIQATVGDDRHGVGIDKFLVSVDLYMSVFSWLLFLLFENSLYQSHSQHVIH